MVCSNITSVDHRVPHRFVRVVDAHLRSNAPSETLCGSTLHLVKVFEIVLDRGVPILRCNTIHTFITHLELFSVVSISFPRFEELHGQIVQMLEVVGRVGYLITLYPKQSQVFQDALLKFRLQNK